MKRAILCLSLLACGLAGTSAAARDAAEQRAQRERIKTERAHAEAVFAQRQRECSERFVVTSCIDEARRDRRQAIERLDRREAALNEAERKQRAALRMEAIRAKVAENEVKRPRKPGLPPSSP
jgi:colicin import membrane protein